MLNWMVLNTGVPSAHTHTHTHTHTLRGVGSYWKTEIWVDSCLDETMMFITKRVAFTEPLNS